MTETEIEQDETTAEPIPDAVPGMEVEIARHREMALPPAGALPSASEFAASMAIAREIAGTAFVPSSYRGKPEEVLAAILKGRELGIGPMTALSDINMIDGRATLSASLMLSQMRRGGLVILESESTSERAFIKAQRSDTGEVAEVEWTFEEATKITRGSKKLSDGDGWKNYPSDMLWARCVGRLARRLGSDLLAGMVYSKEELGDLSGFDEGYDATAKQTVKWDSWDPGKLHPDAPRGWKEILAMMEGVDPSRDWVALVAVILEEAYGHTGKVADLGAKEVNVGTRMANMIARLQFDLMEGKEFPPPNDSEIEEAILWAHAVAVSPPYPEKVETVEGEEVEEGGSDAALTPEESAALQAAEGDLPEFGEEVKS